MCHLQAPRVDCVTGGWVSLLIRVSHRRPTALPSPRTTDMSLLLATGITASSALPQTRVRSWLSAVQCNSVDATSKFSVSNPFLGYSFTGNW